MVSEGRQIRNEPGFEQLAGKISNRPGKRFLRTARSGNPFWLESKNDWRDFSEYESNISGRSPQKHPGALHLLMDNAAPARSSTW